MSQDVDEVDIPGTEGWIGVLPNHAPLVIAEQFGTLATLYGDRIDLGLGRAPGTDMATARALRRGKDADHFPNDVVELIGYLADPDPAAPVRAVILQ